MPTLIEVRSNIAENRAADYERNKKFEEVTDLAERVGFPIRTTISYYLRGESLVACTDTKNRAFVEQTYQAKQEGINTFTGDQAFEAVRRGHEHDEAIMVERFARGELGGNVLAKVSRVPDAVVEGRTSIKGYRRDTLRTFVRVYCKTLSGVDCIIFSLDHNDEAGLSSVGEKIGMQIVGRPSESVLADSRLYDVDDPSSFADGLVDECISSYDDAIYQNTGEVRHAGSIFVDQTDAHAAVDMQSDLLHSHFKAISAIAGMALNEAAKEDLYEVERGRTSAAIALRYRGVEVGSSSDASVSAELESGNYERDCSTATENGMQQGNKGGEEISMTCPFCGLTTVGDPCAFRLVCGKCDAEVRGGRLWDKGIGRAAALARQAQASVFGSEPRPSLDRKNTSTNKVDKDSIQRLFGANAIVRSELAIGGRDRFVVDKVTNEVYAKL